MPEQTPIQMLLERIRLNWPDAASPETDIIFAAIRFYDLIRAQTEEAVSAFGLTHSAFEVLVALRAQPRPRQLTPSDICKSALLTSGGTANILVGLERKGLVARFPNPEDGRSKIVQLTEKGEELIGRAMDRVMEKDRALFDSFQGTAEIEKFREIFLSMMRSLEA